MILINPKITIKSLKKYNDEEGCFSIPGVYGNVKRHKKIKVKAMSIKGELIEFSAEGMFARVIQHEIDHLNGVLFIDKAIEITKGELDK